MEIESDMDQQSHKALPQPLHAEHPARAFRRKYPAGQEGFAMVSGLVVIPLLLAVCVVVAAAFVVFKRKSLAQLLCIQQAVKTQEELRGTLRELLKMNSQAKTLRAQREAADRGFQAAQASGYPPAIAAAAAVKAAVIAAQLIFRSRQEALLLKADSQRRQGKQNMRGKMDGRYMSNLTAQQYYPRGLAVYPKQPFSLTPDYVPVPGFKYFQQQRYSYKVDLYPGEIPSVLQPDTRGPNRNYKNNLNRAKVQVTECSASLDNEDENWKIQIVAASARSK